MAGVSSVPAMLSPATMDPTPALAPSTDVTKTTAAAQVTNTDSPDSTAKPASANNGSTEPKKDRKPRRERLPLPDPIPIESVKRYTEPSKSELQTEVDAVDSKIQVCFDRLNTTRAFYDERQKIRDAGKPAYDAARKRFNELNETCRLFFEARKEISTKLKSLREADMAARNASSSFFEMPGVGKDGNEALKSIRTIEELDARIKELEYSLGVNTYSMLEEKKIVTQISFLQNKGRDFILSKDKSYKDEKAAKEVRIGTRKELEEARGKQDVLIDAAKTKVDAQKKVVDAIRAEHEDQIKKLQVNSADIDRDAEKKKIGEMKGAIRKLRDDFQVKLDKWYLNERIHYEQQKIAKRKKYEAVQAEREARRKAWEEEQAQYPEPDPYQEQKDMCSGLTVYMQTLIGETVGKPSVNLRGTSSGVAPSLKTTSNTREISAAGKAIGKLATGKGDEFESLAFSDFVKKSGKSKGKKGRRAAGASTTDSSSEAADTPLKPHSIDYLTAFTELEITPPKRLSEVRAALDKVKEKKAYYDALPKPTAEETAKMAVKKSRKQAAPSSEKKKASGVDLMNGDAGSSAFPVLLSEGSAPVAARDISGPSFKAVASGIASAPAPVIISSNDMPSMDDEGTAGIVEAAIGVDGIVVEEPHDEGNIGQADPTPAEA